MARWFNVGGRNGTGNFPCRLIGRPPMHFAALLQSLDALLSALFVSRRKAIIFKAPTARADTGRASSCALCNHTFPKRLPIQSNVVLAAQIEMYQQPASRVALRPTSVNLVAFCSYGLRLQIHHCRAISPPVAMLLNGRGSSSFGGSLVCHHDY